MQNPKWVCFSISSKQMGVADTVTETHGACSQSMVLCHKRHWSSPWLYTRSEIQVGRFFFVSPPRGGETKYTLKDTPLAYFVSEQVFPNGTYLKLGLPLYSFCHSVFLSFYLSFCLSVFISVYLSVFLSFLLRPIFCFFLHVFLYNFLYGFLSLFAYFCLSLFPDFCFLTFYVSIFTSSSSSICFFFVLRVIFFVSLSVFVSFILSLLLSFFRFFTSFLPSCVLLLSVFLVRIYILSFLLFLSFFL